MAESELHKKLKGKAINWLNQTGCSIVAEEVSFRGDLFDVVGIKDNGIKYCVEAKATQKDLNGDRQVKNTTDYGKGNFNFYYLVLPEELKPGYEWSDWGIIRMLKAEYDFGAAIFLPHIERKAKRFESLKTFPETIEIIMAVAKKLTNQIYYGENR